MNRREFFEKIMRYSLFSVLAALAGFLILKDENNEACDLDFVCKNCKINKSCNLEQANSFRKNNIKL